MFLMTATGQTSGLTAQYRFTDSVSSVSLGSTSETVTAGGTSGNYGVTVNFSSFGTQHATLTITSSTLPASAIANFGTNPVTSSGFPETGTSSLTISTTCGTTPQVLTHSR